MVDKVKALTYLLHFLVNKYKYLDDIDELYSCAFSGLLEGITTFDESYNIEISTHVYNYIRYSILNTYKNKDKVIYVDDMSKYTDSLSTDITQDKTDYTSLYNGIEKLTDRTRSIILDRFGFNGDPMSLSDLSNKHDLSITRITSIINKGLRDLKLYIEEGD